MPFLSAKLCTHSRQFGTDARFECDVKKTGDLRGQNHGHCVVEHALSKKQSVQIHIYLQLIEDSQDRHCEQTQAHLRVGVWTDPNHDIDHGASMYNDTVNVAMQLPRFYFSFHYTSTSLICMNRR